MIADDEFAAIAKGLYNKSRAEKVAWTPDRNKDIFWLNLPHSKVRLAYERPTAEPDYIEVQLLPADGEPVVNRKVYEGDTYWQLVSDLYWLVNRQVVGWDKVLEDIHRFIGAPEKAGR